MIIILILTALPGASKYLRVNRPDSNLVREDTVYMHRFFFYVEVSGTSICQTKSSLV